MEYLCLMRIYYYYYTKSFGWCARGGFPERGELILARSLLGREGC